MDKQKLASTPVGPPFYENWHNSLRGEPLHRAYEVPLFTDARFTGMVTEGYGPYQFLNAISTHDKTMRAALVLRADSFLVFELDEEIKTNEEHYHGGWLADEAAALVSLCLGVRLKAGSVSREFGANDPKGFPRGWDEHKPTLNISDPKRLVVPSAANDQRSLDDLAPLQSLPKLSPQAAGALTRAARLYQEALWICESEPELSWLLIVSAVETAAGFWRPGAHTKKNRPVWLLEQERTNGLLKTSPFTCTHLNT